MKEKEESEKADLKLIQKMKIMASDPVTWWQIHRDNIDKVSDLSF